MKHISILIPDSDFNLSSVEATFKMFSKVNAHNKTVGKKDAFKIVLVGNKKKVALIDGMFSVRPEVSFKDVSKTDLIVIPAMGWDKATLTRNQVYSPWIIQQYKNGAEVASICTGAFLLATTGLLDDKHCSTHWLAADLFKQMFPRVKLVADKLITDEHRIYTNGGAFSFLNLLLYLVEKYSGREVAIYCAKVFEIDINRNCQSPFNIFLGQKGHADEPIKNAQQFIENNVTRKISLDDLANELSISKRNFERRFKKATSNTPAEYIQRAKIEFAKKHLETGSKHVNEVMYAVGYSDRKAFRTVFKKITGLSPGDYRNRYNKEAVD